MFSSFIYLHGRFLSVNVWQTTGTDINSMSTLLIMKLLLWSQDAQGHRQRELQAAEDGLSKAQREAEQATAALGNRGQEMATLQLEVEELEKSIAAQHEQV